MWEAQQDEEIVEELKEDTKEKGFSSIARGCKLEVTREVKHREYEIGESRQ